MEKRKELTSMIEVGVGIAFLLVGGSKYTDFIGAVLLLWGIIDFAMLAWSKKYQKENIVELDSLTSQICQTCGSKIDGEYTKCPVCGSELKKQ